MTRKYEVTLEDGRTLTVCAQSEDLAKRQANHAEMSRVVIASKRGLPTGPAPSMAVSVSCLEG